MLINSNQDNFIKDDDILFEFAKTKILDKNLDDKKILTKYINHFRSRGFESEVILKVIKKIKSYEK